VDGCYVSILGCSLKGFGSLFEAFPRIRFIYLRVIPRTEKGSMPAAVPACGG